MHVDLCSCLHVEGGSDPAHGHGWFQCPDCGGMCVTEKWCGHAVAGLRWMEAMMQQHRHGQIVVQGLNFIQDRMLEAATRMLPPAQGREIGRMIQRELGNLSHIWHQSSMGDSLYSKDEARPRLYEESADVLAQKLAAVTNGVSPEEFLRAFAPRDTITPAEALQRAKVLPALPPQEAPCQITE